MDKHIDEHELNPAPHKYKVSSVTKVIFLLMFIMGVGAYFYSVISRRVAQSKFMLENQMAAVRLAPTRVPELMLSDPLNEEVTSLSKHLGQWTLLNIWATWCPPCQEEMPSLELLHKKMGHQIKIIALSVDDNIEALKEFMRSHKPSFDIFHDREQISPRLLGISKYPETFLISPEGVLTRQLSGPRDWASAAALNYLVSIIK